MELLFQHTNAIVVVGAWNIAVFTQNWVKENILTEDDKFTVLFPLNIGCSLRFRTDYLTFGIEGSRLVFNAEKNEDISYVKIVKTLRKIVQKLPHTPVSAMGTNFVYKRDGNFEALAALCDNDRLINTIVPEQNVIKSSAIVRKFKLTDKEDLTLRIESTESKNIIDFNFNYALKDATSILSIIEDDDFLLQNKTRANDIVNNVYSE